jgi:hypothetical protein
MPLRLTCRLAAAVRRQSLHINKLDNGEQYTRFF